MFRGFFGLGALVASDLFTAPEIAFFQKVWPTIRVAAQFTDPNWGVLGYPNGPPISGVTAAIIGTNWGNIRRAAQFSDINWADPTLNISAGMLAAAMAITHPAPVAAPVPEVVATPPTATAAPTPTVVQPTVRIPEQSPTAAPLTDTTSPAAAPVPEAQQPTTPYVNAPSTAVYGGGSPAPSAPAPFDWTTLLGPAVPSATNFDQAGNPITPTTTQPGAKQAGMFGGSFPIVAAVALGAAVLFGVLPGPKHGRGRKRRRARA